MSDPKRDPQARSDGAGKDEKEAREIADDLAALREAFMAEMQALVSRRHAALASLVALFDRRKAEAVRKKLSGGT